MERFVIEGGTRLDGVVQTSGAKNAVLPVMDSALQSEGALTVEAAPDLADVRTMRALLQGLGCEIGRQPNGDLEIGATGALEHVAPWAQVR